MGVGLDLVLNLLGNLCSMTHCVCQTACKRIQKKQTSRKSATKKLLYLISAILSFISGFLRMNFSAPPTPPIILDLPTTASMTSSSSGASVSSSDNNLLQISNGGNETGGGLAYECHGATDAELELYYQINWWTEGCAQIVICIIGLCGNTISIPVLCSKKAMNSVFNHLLVFLGSYSLPLHCTVHPPLLRLYLRLAIIVMSGLLQTTKYDFL